MQAKQQIKSKEQKARAATSGGKGKRKKWSKGKTREKLNNAVLYDQETYQRLLKEIPKMKLITTSGISERLKVNGSVARASITELHEKGLIRQVLKSRNQLIYTKA